MGPRPSIETTDVGTPTTAVPVHERASVSHWLAVLGERLSALHGAGIACALIAVLMIVGR